MHQIQHNKLNETEYIFNSYSNMKAYHGKINEFVTNYSLFFEHAYVFIAPVIPHDREQILRTHIVLLQNIGILSNVNITLTSIPSN